MSKHTPGPWKTRMEIIIWIVIMADGKKVCICTCIHTRSKENVSTTPADAAAPEMLNANLIASRS